MTLYTFGGTPADVLTDDAGNVVPNYPLLVKVSGTGATVTALFEADGTTPIATLRTNAADSSTPGAVRTFKAADVTEIDFEYLDASSSPVRWYQAAREVASSALQTAQSALDAVDGKLDLATGDEQDVAGPVIFHEPVTFEGDITAPNLPDLPAARWFMVTGAVGNGSTDDRAVIQAQLDAAHTAGGGIVFIPPGKTYAVSTFLVVYDNTTIWAYGATLKATGTSAGLLRNFLGSETFSGYAGHSHIQVLGGTWDGNASDGSTGSVTAETDVINFVHCADILVKDATIRNVSSAHALEFNSTDGARAVNCRFEGYRDNSGTSARQFSEAVQIDMAKSGSSSIGSFDNTPSKNVLIQGCYFGPSSRLGVFGRAVGSHTVTAGVTYDNIQVIGNRVDGALQDGIYAYGWRRSVIADNIITGTGWSGIKGTIPDPATTAIPPQPRHHRQHGRRAGTDSGIRYVGYSTYKFPGLSIVGNVIKSITGNAIHAEYCQAPAIEGNHVDTTTSTGLYAHYSDSAKSPGTRSSPLAPTRSTCRAAWARCRREPGGHHQLELRDRSWGRVPTARRTARTRSSETRSSRLIAGIRCSTNAVRCTVTGNKVRKGSGSTANSASARLLGDRLRAPEQRLLWQLVVRLDGDECVDCCPCHRAGRHAGSAGVQPGRHGPQPAARPRGGHAAIGTLRDDQPTAAGDLVHAHERHALPGADLAAQGPGHLQHHLRQRQHCGRHSDELVVHAPQQLEGRARQDRRPDDHGVGSEHGDD
jgi:hypothetical protein